MFYVKMSETRKVRTFVWYT